jgi:hypothetical protein
MAYIVPSVRIFQEFGVSPLSQSPQLNAVIVGPNKKFLDYSRSDDKQTSFAGTYDNSITNVVQYPAREAGDVVDQETVEVRFDELLADFFTGTDGTTDALEDTVLRSGTPGFYFANSTSPDGTSYLADSSLHTRGVKVGDAIEVTNGATLHSTRVTGFVEEKVDPVLGSFSADSLNHQAVNFVGVYSEPTVNLVTDTEPGNGSLGVNGIYQHPTEDTTYTVTCTTPGTLGTAVFDVSDLGTDLLVTNVLSTVALQEEYVLGTRGLTLVLQDNGIGFNTGDSWTIGCSAPSNQNGVLEKAGSYTGNTSIVYTITVVDKGVSGVARVLVTTPLDEDNSGPVVVQEGVPFPVGSRGAQAKITFPSGGVLIPGDSWTLSGIGNGLGPVTETDVVSEADSASLSGDFINSDDVVLELTTVQSGPFGTALVDWEMRTASDDVIPFKERLLHENQLIDGGSGGICQAILCALDSDLNDTDTFIIDDGVTTETFTAVAAAPGAFQFIAGTGLAATQTNLVAAINADSTLWSAVETNNLGRYFSPTDTGSQFIVHRTAPIATSTSDRVHGVLTGSQSDIQVIEFGSGTQDYNPLSGTQSDLPDTLPPSKTFGFGRVFGGLAQNDAHRVSEQVSEKIWNSSTMDFLDYGQRHAVINSGRITTGGSDDSSTKYLLDLGVSVSLTPDSGSFTLDHKSTSRLWSDGQGLPAQGTVHDTVSDDLSLVTLEALGADANYATATLGFDDAPDAGTATAQGLYYSSEAGVYTLTKTAGGVLGDCVFTVSHAGSDAGHTITTQAGVNRYFVGSRGLVINFTDDFDSGPAIGGADLDTITVTPTPKADMSIASGYEFDNLLTYVVTCTTGGLIGVAEFSVTSTNGVDDVANFVSAAGANAIGTRGISVTLDDASGTVAFVAGQSWTIDTAVDSRYTASVDNTYTVEVTRGGVFGVAEVTVTSTLGDSSGPFVLQEDSRPRFVGTSLPFRVGTAGLLGTIVDTQRSVTSPDLAATFVEGDRWRISPEAEEIKGLNGLVLANMLPAALLDATGLTYNVRLKLDDVLIPEEDPSGDANYTTDTTTVSLVPGIEVRSPDVFDIILGDPVPFDMPVHSANMHITYASIATAATSSLGSVSTVSEIESQLGRIDPRNPLAYACFKAQQNSNIAIFYLRVATDDAEGYQSAIQTLEQADNVYAIAPLTRDPEIIGAFKTHVNLMSTPDKGLWRIVIANQDLVVQDVFLKDREDNLGQTVDLTATLVDDPNSADLNPPIFTKVVDPNGSFLLSGVSAGDIFLTDFVTNSPLTATSAYEIDQVVSDDILILKDGPNAPVIVAQKYEIARPFTKDEQAQNHAAIAESYGDHRVYLIWPDEVEADGQSVEGFYLAAAIAGMVAAFPPHQGFTNIAIAGFAAVPRTTEYFTQEQLNVMAAAGVYIVTQSASGGQVFARHQISTDNTSIELRELSITKNFDALSYDFKAALEPFIGVWNVTEDAVGAIEATLLGRIEFNKANKLPKIGAPLIDANINSIAQDPLLCDHVNVDVDLELPCPLNNINLTLRI